MPYSDTYDAALAKYKKKLAAWTKAKKRLDAGDDNAFGKEFGPTGLSPANPINNVIPGLGGLLGLFGGDDKPKPPPKPKLPAEVRLTRKYLNQGRALLNAQTDLLPRAVDIQAKANKNYADLQYDNFAANAPRYVEAITTADPMQSALRLSLNEAAMEDLHGGLSPSSAREIQQGSRAAWADRGLASSPASAIEELFSLGERGWQHRNAAMTNALNVGTFNRQVIGDPFLAVTGRSSVPNAPDYTSFTNPLAHDIYNTQQSIDFNQKLANQNAKAAKDAANKQLIGTIAGSLIGAGGTAASAFI